MSSPVMPPNVEESQALSETASKLERLREMARKYSTSEGSGRDEASEQALETHEVVELQAFVRHREWIEEKIKFLESLPSIDIFVGTEELFKTYDQITALPTRAQLDGWVTEHDRIDKEAEALDAGDLRKLKAVTKAATQRNLSPEDTDLIEITLTTLFALDKLLHLLRDRSEQLDLFGSRLTWEEQRASAYSLRDELLSSIQLFLDNRGRWRTHIYTTDCATSSNVNLDQSSASIIDPYSRSSRFKLSEEVSREVVHLSSRISSLRHGPVLSSGKVLDKLIEDSRKPVPDSMLDEQDRVEEKCEKELSSVGKFLMTVNMQWKKADEVYVETRKDLAALGALSNEIQSALTQLPSRQKETAFSNRIESLKKRLQSRLDQSMPGGVPLPKHPLFPDQVTFNEELVSTLSDEAEQAQTSLSKVAAGIISYRAGCDALDEAEKLRKDISDLQNEVASITDQLQNGFDAGDGDGSPPDLAQNSCVQPIRFSAFLATLPTLSERSAQIEESSLKTIKRARLASLRLTKPGITSEFRQDYVKEIEALEAQLHAMAKARNDVSTVANRLKEVRRVWSALDDAAKSLECITPGLTEALLKNRWKQQIGGESAPPTPESPNSELPAAMATPESINVQVSSIKERLEKDVIAPFAVLSQSIPASLHDFIYARQLSIERSIFDLQSMNRLLTDVRGQTYAMETIREEVHVLEGRIEDSKVQYDDHYEAMLSSCDVESNSGTPASALPEGEEEQLNVKGQALSRSVDAVQDDVDALVKSLPTRVPLISRHSPSSSAEGALLGRARASSLARLPFDPATVDRAVRNDTNAYSIRLTGGVRSLQQKRSFRAFYRAAREMNKGTTLLRKDIRSLTEQLEQYMRELDELADAPLEGEGDGLSALVALKESLEALQKVEATRLRSLVSGIRDNVTRMQSIPGVQEDAVTRSTLSARLYAFAEIDSHANCILDRLETLKSNVSQVEQRELATLEEKARKEQEAAESQRREQARLQEEREESARRAKEKFEEEASFRIQDESTPRRDVRRTGFGVVEDVFGPDSPSRQELDRETAELLALVRSLRRRLKSIGLNAVVRPSGASHGRSHSASLPQVETAEAMTAEFSLLEVETSKLPVSIGNTTADTELRSLRLEMEASRELLSRVQHLARLQPFITLCDSTFSTFLDYIDSYPNRPQPADGSGSGPSEIGSSALTSEERLSEKMSYAKGIFSDMCEHFAPVADDPRAIAEHGRLKQTWEELTEMALEKISGRTSRAGSVASYNSSGRNSTASMRSNNTSEGKRHRYNNLSITGKDGLLAPTPLSQRRAASASSAGSGSIKQPQRRSARPSLPVAKPSNPRSISGQMRQTNLTSMPRPGSSLFSSTFASRQRTSSITSNASSVAPTTKPTVPTTSRRRMSSTLSETSRAVSPALSTSTRGAWSRTPRQSFSGFQRPSTPDRLRKPRQKYVANPKNKLDVALGDIINNLPVDINVEAVTDTWKDKSGKYWIGGNEPKLCFCRILRSQTVMVRVGGGWTELSKFIKDHFSDLFRLLPETPPRPGSASKERWINATTLRNAEDSNSPGSPESIGRNLPSFAISTPDGTQKSGSPRSSPLTPIQFIRRADANASEISLSSIALSNDLSTSGISTASSIRPRRRMSSVSQKFSWKP